MPGTLTHSPAAIVRQLLIDLGLVTASGTWPVKVSAEPDTPDNVVTIYDTAGETQGRIQYSGEVTDFHGLQIRVRAIDHPTGWAKVNAITTACAETVKRTTVAVSGTSYTVHAMTRRSGILAIGKDVPSSKRNLFTVNYTVSITQN